MEISSEHEVINEKYMDAKLELLDCLTVQFNKYKRDHKGFDKFANDPATNEFCKTQRDDLLKLINEGIYDYGKFNKVE